jgi:hypothetical protein
MVAYRFEESRSGDCVARHLAGFGGLLQVDGYAAYNRLAKGAGANDGVTLAACLAHVRRRFYELHVNESSRLATQTRARHASRRRSPGGAGAECTVAPLAVELREGAKTATTSMAGTPRRWQQPAGGYARPPICSAS